MMTFTELGTAIILEALYRNDARDSRLSRGSWYACWGHRLERVILVRALAGLPF